MESSSSSDLICLTDPNTRLKVSSTIEGNSNEYSKKNIFDNNPESSWYSSQGKFQYVCIFFDQSVSISELSITFSGGFSPKEIELAYSESDEFENKKPNLTKTETISIEDKSEAQKIILTKPINNCKTLRILMRKFYDLYGRVIIYDMKIFGKKI